ncbi:MAG: RdgB/HAM1 family non-canonical purine NTP pyrophosphatase [Chloroflexi bacterium]|nr:RdgB/HAM1 family non-canonical purine NTP pyrophosphatase [Chloroflexota bacterium]
MAHPDKLLLATHNQGKVGEFRHLLKDSPFVLVTPSELSISMVVDESGDTYEENASIKARAFSAASGLVSLADDSGLEVDALDGAPGPRSARYAAPDASDGQNLALLLRNMAGVPWERRTARFVCVVAIAIPSGEVELCRASCEGIIGLEPSGASGFGYDPVFYLPQLGKTMAQLDMEGKNRISHRARAVRRAVSIIEKMVALNRE